MPALRAATRDERGFTMIVVIGALMLVTLLSAAALATAGGDMRSTGYATGQKQAYEAADAGLNWFEAQLGQDPNYWQKCTSVPQVGTPASAAPVNNAWNGTGSDPRVWRGVDGNPSPSPTQSAYTIELLPATPGTPCSTADPAGTMITSSGTFRIRVTGRGNANGARRSVVATFRRRGFLDYLWYTDFETSDPTIAPMTHGYTSSNPPFDQWAADPVNGCAKHFYEGRASNGYSGTVNGTQVTNVRCAEIQFVTGDTMAGPMHSNDSLLVNGTPSFGRVDGQGNPIGDRIESSAPGADNASQRTSSTYTGPWRDATGSSNPNFHNGLVGGVNQMTAPPNNAGLAASATYTFTGQTHIVLNGSQMTATDQNGGPTTYTIYPNTVIWVRNGTACPNPIYDPFNPYGDSSDCADVYVHGSYSQDMTIGSAKDVVVDGDVTRPANNLLGLIANYYVRVYHPVSSTSGGAPQTPSWSNGSCNSQNAAGALNGVTITAAILAVQHSFLVDNYRCGAQFSNRLTVVGAIAQRFRGPVGTGGGSGYLKNYSYDDALKYRSPPRFLDPVQASWKLVSLAEQKPAT